MDYSRGTNISRKSALSVLTLAYPNWLEYSLLFFFVLPVFSFVIFIVNSRHVLPISETLLNLQNSHMSCIAYYGNSPKFNGRSLSSSRISNMVYTIILCCLDVQSGRRTCYWETGVVLRITFSFSYFIFICVLFINFILDIINGVLYPVKQLDPFSRKITQTLLCTPSHHSHMRLLLRCIASVHYLLPTISLFKSVPSYLSPMV